MTIETKRLVLRPWVEEDAESLYEYAKNPDVGPIAGWPPHKNIEESREIIKHVLSGKQCYAICLKSDNKAIGAIELKLNGHTDMTERDDECELAYWIGKPFWGNGYMPEAANALIAYGFQKLGMTTIWCGYYDGNEKSKRVQEKCGFVYYRTTNDVEVPLMNEIRIGHTNILTKERFECPFCNIISRKAEANIVYETENIIALLDIAPINEGHILIIPKLHEASIENIPIHILTEVLEVAQKILPALKKVYNYDGYTLMQNGDEFCDFGHGHFHIFPRYKNDGFGWKCPEGAFESSEKVAVRLRNAMNE